MWFNCLGINSYGKNTWKWAISLGVVDLLGMGYRITNVFIYCDQKKTRVVQLNIDFLALLELKHWDCCLKMNRNMSQNMQHSLFVYLFICWLFYLYLFKHSKNKNNCRYFSIYFYPHFGVSHKKPWMETPRCA